MPTKTQGERVASLEQWVRDHEARCEERLGEIKATATETRAAIGKLQWWVIGLIVAVCGALGLTLLTVVLHATGLS